MEKWYSIRMRASEGGPHEKGGRHISGAERIIKEKELEQIAANMIKRALTHSRGEPDFISLKVDKIEQEAVHIISPITIQKIDNKGQDETKAVLKKLLAPLPLKEEVLFFLYDWMIEDDQTRGAIIVDIHSGKRIDNQGLRGVRVSHFDWDKSFQEKWIQNKKDFHNERRLEAVALASKVAKAGTICELCCSDDPEYTTGYVTFQHTYVQIPNMKKKDVPRGGRVFLVDASTIDLDAYMNFLEKTPVLIGGSK